MLARLASLPVAIGAAMLALLASAPGQQKDDTERRPPIEKSPPAATVVVASSKVAEQSFPPNGVMETAWKVEWDTAKGHGLIIKSAYFKRSPAHDWMQVLGDARVSELFVPYNIGDPRFWDVSQYYFPLSTLSAADAGPFGKLHISSDGNRLVPCVVEEIRERGVIWKSYAGVRRGHALVLWGCIDAANYRYLVEYNFQDDGAIVFKVGATGVNYRGREWTPHMHNTLWRIDVNVDGPSNNTALLMERIEPMDEISQHKATSLHYRFNDGKEGGADWDPAKFTMLRVINTQKKNARGEYYAYDLVPSRMGNSRHFGNKEECMLHDFWVTKADPTKLQYRKLPEYIKGDNIEDTDIVVWYSAPLYHEPRSEDGVVLNNQMTGCTHVGWSSFMLRPSNIFDRTPLFPYKDAAK
jgi:Cu2+-containing amine oxidase